MKELEEVKEAFRELLLVSKPSLFLIHLEQKIQALEKAIEKESNKATAPDRQGLRPSGR